MISSILVQHIIEVKLDYLLGVNCQIQKYKQFGVKIVSNIKIVVCPNAIRGCIVV